MGLELIVGLVVGLLVLWIALLALFFVLRPKDVPLRELLAVVRMSCGCFGPSCVTAVPTDVRMVVVGLVAWILSPIDLIPEFIPVLGPLDDVVVAVVAMRYVRRARRHRRSRDPLAGDGGRLRAPDQGDRGGLTAARTALDRMGQAVTFWAAFAGWRIRIALPKGSRTPMSVP